jgi:hypothetical protein
MAPTSAEMEKAPAMALSSHVTPADSAALLYHALFPLFFSRQLKNLFTNMRRGVPTAVYMAMMVCTLWVAFAPVCSPPFPPLLGGYGTGLLPFVSHSLPRSLFFWGGVGPRSAPLCLALSPLARFMSLPSFLTLPLSLSLSLSRSLSRSL